MQPSPPEAATDLPLAALRAALKGQYHAALDMLKQAIENCPEELWLAGGHNPSWQIAYHALFFTHLYLQKEWGSFTPWEHARDEYECLGNPPYAPDRPPNTGEPYTKDQILDYWRVCDAMINGAVDAMDLLAPECGFPWYKLPKLDHQLVNIRHTQHHAAQIADRVRNVAGVGVKWQGRRPAQS